MAARFPCPIQEDIRDLLVDLLGRGAAASKAVPLELDGERPAAVAEYVTDDGETGALCVVDGPFAVRAGAALVMVPSAVAEESVAAPEVPDTYLENVQEVVNVLARLLNSASTPHLRLQALHPLPGELPGAVDELLAAPGFRRDFAVHIEGYGEGRLSLLVA